jgi:hypothetical protein
VQAAVQVPSAEYRVRVHAQRTRKKKAPCAVCRVPSVPRAVCRVPCCFRVRVRRSSGCGIRRDARCTCPRVRVRVRVLTCSPIAYLLLKYKAKTKYEHTKQTHSAPRLQPSHTACAPLSSKGRPLPHATRAHGLCREVLDCRLEHTHHTYVAKSQTWSIVSAYLPNALAAAIAASSAPAPFAEPIA